jgi:putative transposase
MTKDRDPRVHERWARFRFAIVGPLLAAPPEKGALRAALSDLAARQWRHPVSGRPVRFGFSTLERWLLKARKERQDPVGVLGRKRRRDAGHQAAISDALQRFLTAQYEAHKAWSIRLHYDNAKAAAEKRPELRPTPSYATVRRFMRANGLNKHRRVLARETAGALAAEARLAEREVRSYEAEYVGALLHFDYHHCSRKVLTSKGEWHRPKLLGIVDDRSRLACHLQWFWSESAANLAHGLIQAFLRRGLPRAVMSDNGAAMIAAEISEGLAHLSVLHQRTLPYTPAANGKIEVLWASIEGRLMAMLEGVEELDLARLNEATLAWAEFDYNRKIHSETHEAPLGRFLAGPTVMRPCPDSVALKAAFTRAERRVVRRSDGTIVIEGRRFEVPNHYRHLASLEVRYASWDLSLVHLVDEQTGTVLCRLFPLDKTKNADGLRRALDPVSGTQRPQADASLGLPRDKQNENPSIRMRRALPPLLAKILDVQAATGLPPAYLVKDDDEGEAP